MFKLDESDVEVAALEWPGDLGYSVGHGPDLAPGEVAAERDSGADAVLLGRLREAMRRLNPAMPPRTLAISRDSPPPKPASRGLRVAATS
jgi:type I restriction enzyme R subunit